jgi:GntR family transcriptional regulator/MocR family aminotransferase
VGLSGLSAGFHAVAYLRSGSAEDAVIGAARDRGVGLYGLRRYRLDDESGEQGLVIGFGNVTERAIVRGVAEVADLL